MCVVKTPKITSGTEKPKDPTIIRSRYLDGVDPTQKAMRTGRSSLRIQRTGGRPATAAGAPVTPPPASLVPPPEVPTTAMPPAWQDMPVLGGGGGVGFGRGRIIRNERPV